MDSLTIAISAGSAPELLQRLRASIAKQNFLGVLEVLAARPAGSEDLSLTRNKMYAAARGNWVYFIDEDCELPDAEFVQRLIRALKVTGGGVGGGYLNCASGIWSHAYNSLVCCWLGLHASQHQALPVAGNFAIPKLAQDDGRFPFCERSFFGGEEIGVMKNLRRAGIDFQLRLELTVRHFGKKSMFSFYSRAWLHGQREFQAVGVGPGVRGLIHWIHGEAGPKVGVLMVSYLLVVQLSRAKALAFRQISKIGVKFKQRIEV